MVEDFEQNEERRKRRRTLSPSAPVPRSCNSDKSEGADFLKTTVSVRVPLPENSLRPVTKNTELGKPDTDEPNRANGNNTRPKLHVESASVVHGEDQVLEKSQQASEDSSAKPGQKLLKVRADGTLTSPKTDAFPQSVPSKRKTSRVRSHDSRLATDRAEGDLKQEIPLAKTLKVCSDGKLGTAETEQISTNTKPERRRRSKKTQTKLNPLVATVRYGTDDTSRSIIGQSIDDILSGRQVVSKSAKAKPSKPTHPPKRTHPFFQGGMAHSSDWKAADSNDKQQQSDPNETATSQRQTLVNPRKSRVISKPADFQDSSVEDKAPERNPFGSDHARIARFPGAIDPIWPPLDMLRIEPESESPDIAHLGVHHDPQTQGRCRKLKGPEMVVPGEQEVLKPFLDLVHKDKADRAMSRTVELHDWAKSRRPLRRLMTGHDLQRAVSQELSTNFTNLHPKSSEQGVVEHISIPQALQSGAHKALQQVFEQIPHSSTAFDRFECETQDWIHKYSPKTADSVLQEGCEVQLLRDWLKGLAISSTSDLESSGREPSTIRKIGSKPGKRKRKRPEEFDDFVVSSDEESNQLDELIEPEDHLSVNPLLRKTIIRSSNVTGFPGICDRRTNAIVISGPNGCGKTAAVYAAAQELGFEVFEINAGSRRSGKDILDRVGDMTRNHLVRKVHQEGLATPNDEKQELDVFNEKLKQDLESGRQGTMNSFFKTKVPPKKTRLERKGNTTKASPQKKLPNKQQQHHKQSLILLEEVDLLFEEDKAFWPTVVDLMLQSKRPVIMTCTDENMLHLDQILLHAILRFNPPPEQLAIDYLLLVACNEGHLLSRDAVLALYRARDSDLRASLTELNFFCQMAVGDAKGGLAWMFINPTDNKSSKDKTESLRVVSDGTYRPFMGLLSSESHLHAGEYSTDEETERLSDIWNVWGIDVESSPQCLSGSVSDATSKSLRSSIFEALKNFDQAAEASSAADTLPACVCRQPNHAVLEPAVPEMTEKTRSNYVEGSNILLADPFPDHGRVAESLSLTLRTQAKRLLHGSLTEDEALVPYDDGHFISRRLPDILQHRRIRLPISRTYFSAAFEPIASSTNSALSIPKGPQISSFEGPTSVVAEDLAPYVRNIVSYDLRLEEQRRQLDSLLLGSGKGGKKARTTRSSRAALEGGQKAHTRRERWFPNNTNFSLIMQSGGEGWNDALERMMIDTTRKVTEPSTPDRSGSVPRDTKVEHDM